MKNSHQLRDRDSQKQDVLMHCSLLAVQKQSCSMHGQSSPGGGFLGGMLKYKKADNPLKSLKALCHFTSHIAQGTCYDRMHY